jgi:hypothetical protein
MILFLPQKYFIREIHSVIHNFNYVESNEFRLSLNPRLVIFKPLMVQFHSNAFCSVPPDFPLLQK